MICGVTVGWFDIYHECYHYETHYAFYVLQQMGCNDLREMDDLVIEVDEEEKVSNPIYWIETQANRGAYALMMPVTEMRELTRQELAKVQNPKHREDLYQQAGESIARILHKPHFRIRARLIQLGHIHARGALNYVDGSPIEPFDFDDEAWKEDNCTFVIDRYHSGKIYAKNKDYQALLDTGKFVYADGHIVRNAPEYVTWDKERHILTPWAYRNVDQCCLRFMKEYKLKNIGRYIRGRLNYDAAYATQMEFYMRDIINQKQLELDEAKQEYVQAVQQGRRQGLTGTVCPVRVQGVSGLIWKNNSGYFDPTAGEALSRIIREEKRRKRMLRNADRRDTHRTISGTGQRHRSPGGQGLSVHTPPAEASPGGQRSMEESP